MLISKLIPHRSVNATLFHYVTGIEMVCWFFNREKFYLVEAFVASNNFNIFSISEAYCDSSVENIYGRLKIKGYTFVRSDHPPTMRGGAAICYKNHLPGIRRKDISFLNKRIILEIHLASNKCFLTGLCGSPSWNKNQFHEFCSSFHLHVKHVELLASIIAGDFNALANNWWSKCISNSKVFIIDTLKPASGSSCWYIDSIFISIPGLITECWKEKSLYTDNCHHSITFGKVNLSVFLLPLYLGQ